MRNLLRKKPFLLAYAVVALASIVGGFRYKNMQGEIAEAFETYKSVHAARDVEQEVHLTASAEHSYFADIRYHAEYSSRKIVEELDFRKRMSIMALRTHALRGALSPVALFDRDRHRAFSEAHRLMTPHFDVVAKMDLIFVVPHSPNRAYGYVSLSQEDPDAGFRRYYAPLLLGARYAFVKEDGQWKVDPGPFALNSSASNEAVAKLLEPTGNKFIFNMMSAVTAEDEAALWRPLLTHQRFAKYSNLMEPPS